MTRVLFVVTAAEHWTLNDGSKHPTGYWGEELAMPHKAFTEAGWEIAIATPGGRRPRLDEISMGRTAGLPGTIREVADYLSSIQDALDSPAPLSEMDPDDFDLVFYPGGHGPMEDLAYDEVSGALLTKRLASGRPLALLCHGPAALLAAKGKDGSWPFAGYRVTALSNIEEKLNSFGRKAPWFLEDRLREYGADYAKGKIPLLPHIEVDRSLYTGQNPGSAKQLAKRLVADLA
ncbi:type 1 glutamine amidotransferase domain-containing protein [Actinomadura macrotermitis]|uniref:Protein/nucleic acid deglycase HchA n=1 Tax=Actinomadura macrotermitis TaxID=2585200 RepID=A0A7K0BLR7_9ACTN|nr:type 1 glutamine amidotransferase domain-containing protein [Actinomadura macrotermitis]MQY02123.1 Protein/nucleic acid deglycase HchA [Actinomadura macrotermitis]